MKSVNSIVIKADVANTFIVASDLPRWPEFLSHYRYNRYLSQLPWGGIIKMSAWRAVLPLTWVSIYRMNRAQYRLEFEHIKSAFNTTRGMKVEWTFTEVPEGVRVEIIHEHELAWPVVGAFVCKNIVTDQLIHPIATRTLAGLKAKMESLV